MRFLIDECLHESLIILAHAAGFAATHVNHLGLTGASDHALAERSAADELTFVTNNRVDFLRLFKGFELHAGLIVMVPNVKPALQRALFGAALEYLRGKDLTNTVIEVNVKDASVRCIEYRLPATS